MGFKSELTSRPLGTSTLDKGQIARRLGEQHVIPRTIEKSRQALSVDGHDMAFYQRKLTGRRCSCFGIEDSPDATCSVCLGTAVVGGYEKYGTYTAVLDTTYPNTACVNVAPDYGLQARPVPFSLMHASRVTNGSVLFDLKLPKQGLSIDTLQIYKRSTQGSSTVSQWIKSPTDEVFVELTESNLAARLHEGSVQVKVVLARANPDVTPPTFSHILLRVRTLPLELSLIKVDTPRRTKSVILSEYGLQGGIQTLSGYTTYNGIKFKTKDVFIDTQDNSRWKVIEVQEYVALERNLSFDMQLSYVQDFDAEAKLIA